MTRIPARYRIANLSLLLGEPDSVLAQKAAERLGVGSSDILAMAVVKRSLDARKKGRPRWLISVDATLDGALAWIDRIRKEKP